MIRVSDQICNKEVAEYNDASAILFENYKKNLPGGTGSSFNWNLLRNIKTLDMKIILSGAIILDEKCYVVLYIMESPTCAII